MFATATLHAAPFWVAIVSLLVVSAVLIRRLLISRRRQRALRARSTHLLGDTHRPRRGPSHRTRRRDLTPEQQDELDLW